MCKYVTHRVYIVLWYTESVFSCMSQVYPNNIVRRSNRRGHGDPVFRLGYLSRGKSYLLMWSGAADKSQSRDCGVL
jgi:hypothetical protein